MKILNWVVEFFRIRHSTNYEKKIELDNQKEIYKSLFRAFYVGLIGVTLYQMTLEKTNYNLLFLAILMSAASFISGFFLGSLFGIPRYNQNIQSQYDLNNSLSDISDWLTKIIVGLGLVNIQRIPGFLETIGDFVRNSSGMKNTSVNVFSICIVLYFSILGLYSGYNYMRLVLSVKYKDADSEMAKKYVEMQKEKEVIEKEKEAIKENFRETLNTQSSSKTGTIESVATSKKDKYVNEIITRAKAIFDLTPEDDKADTQAGFWGGNKTLNSRTIEATVTEITSDLFNVKLIVKSTLSEQPIKEGEIVLFALHRTFYPFYRLVKVNSAGEAVLELISYGSFTVGAIVDEGKTELEYNLVDVPGVSEHFKNT